MSMLSLDALADILKIINLSVKTYICQGISSPWYMSLQYRPQGVFHIVAQGECYLREGNSQTPIYLQSGDVIAFPTGGAHWLSDSIESQDLEAENVIRLGEQGEALLFKSGEVSAFSTGVVHKSVLTQDREDRSTVLLSGIFSYETAINHPFLKDLPCFIKLKRSDERGSDWVTMLINALESESQAPTVGSTLVIDRLAEILFIKLLRTYIQTLEQPSGYIAALADPKIGVALNLIHSETDEGWSIESLPLRRRKRSKPLRGMLKTRIDVNGPSSQKILHNGFWKMILWLDIRVLSSSRTFISWTT